MSVTALHNHFFYDDPKVYFMHVGGEGEAAKLAEGVRKIQDTVKRVRSTASQPAKGFGHKPLPEMSTITAAPLADALGWGIGPAAGLARGVKAALDAQGNSGPGNR